MAVVSILGALIGAGGSVAGGLLSQPEQPDVLLPPTFDPSSDPLTALNALDILASQGVFAPDSILSQAGPLQQAIQRFQAQTPLGGRTRDRGRRQRTIQAFLDPSSEAARMDPDARAAAEAIAVAGGFRSVQEAHQAQQQFEQSVLPRLQSLEEIAGLSRMRGLDVQRQLAEITKGFSPLDFESLLQGQTRRLERGFDERENEILRQANTAGFNPGGQLRGLEQRREDIDLAAITNAIGLLSGQSGAIGQQIGILEALNPSNRAQNLTPGVQQFRIPQSIGAPTVFQPQTDPFGSAVASASQILGGGLISAGQQNQSNQRFDQILQLMQRGSGPGVNGGTNLDLSGLAALGSIA